MRAARCHRHGPPSVVRIDDVPIRRRSFAANRPDLRQRDEAELLALLATGRLRPRVTASFPLDRVTEALQTIADRRVSGKAVVSVAPGREERRRLDPRKAQ
jgi:D-arabinose 1-dehydrogenase-like Zn-dependent alcohol dehydrogenase